MGTYATADEIRRRYPKLFETMGIPSGEVEAAIEDVQNEIDGVLGTKYTIPFAAPVPPLVRIIAKDLASFRVFRSRFINEQPNQSDWVDKLQATANKYLDELTKGDLQLTTADGQQINPRSDAALIPWSSTTGYVPTFGTLPMVDQQVDRQRVLDEEERVRSEDG